MKVLLVATVQSHICQFHRPLVAMLHEYGCVVHVAARNNLAEKNGLKLDFVEEIFDVPFDRSPASARNFKAYSQLKKIIDAEGYEVVHCNTPVGGVVGRLAARDARKRGTRVFYTAHGFHFYKGAAKKNWAIYYPIEKEMCRYTDKLITINEEDYAISKKHFHTEIAHIHGVGTNSKKYARLSDVQRMELKRELGYEDGEKVILCTGELLPNKNQITVIRAMQQVTRRMPEAKLLLAGNGSELSNLKQIVAELGLGEYVQFLGYRTDLERFANVADVIVSASYREGLPMNIVEGMLLAKPVVASVNRGHNELVEPNVTGYLVSPDNADEFAERILRLLSDYALTQRMGEVGFQKAQAYTDIAVQRELEVIYGLGENTL